MEYKIPESWNDITISQFDDLSLMMEIEDPIQRDLQIKSVLLKRPINEIKVMKAFEMNEIEKKLKFILTKPTDHFDKIIEIDGVKYGFITDTSEMTYPEYIDGDVYSSDWDNSRCKLAAMLWRRIIKEDELGYEIEPYDPKNANRVADIFNHKMSYQNLFGAHLFFSHFVIELLRISPQFLVR